MVYPTPTTATEMYEILKQIFYDYRLRIDAYEDAGLEDIILERMTFLEKTDEQLKKDAKDLVYPWFDEEYSKAKKEVETKIEALEKQKENCLEEEIKKRTILTEEVATSTAKIKAEAIKKGYYNCDVMLQKIAELEKYRLSKLEEIENEKEKVLAETEEEITALYLYSAGLEEEYSLYLENKIQAKFVELKKEQEDTKREVFKYNNGLDEKEKRNKNANISANASLKLRYLEIRSESYSKEELVDMGYYDDVLKCVCDYYNSIDDTAEAYKQFLKDTKVVVYLEDYYNNVLSLYRSRAGL